MRARAVNRAIERRGGVLVRQVGSHRRYGVTYSDADGVGRTVHTTVPQHVGDLPVGALRSIERDLEPAYGKGWLR